MMKPAAVPAPVLPRLVAVAPIAERPTPRERGSSRPLRGRKKAGWQAEAPAPLGKAGKVGQTLSSANQQVEPILRAAEDSPVRMVQLATDDPNVVIYWLFEEKGEER
jgi:hypothetical protein